MNIFLDTSALLKLYHKETNTDKLFEFLYNNEIEQIFLSDLAKIEFTSAIWKKIRMKDITEDEGKELIEFFYKDVSKYNWIKLTNNIIQNATEYINVYGNIGLRSLDAIQLASACRLTINNNIIFIAFDKILNNIFKQENLKIFEF